MWHLQFSDIAKKCFGTCVVTHADVVLSLSFFFTYMLNKRTFTYKMEV